MRYSHRPAVRSDLIRIMQYGRPERGKTDPVWDSEWLSTTEAAALMRVERSDVRLLIDEGLLPEDSALGGRHRLHSSLKRSHVERLRAELSAQMPLREFSSRTGLKRAEVEQLFGLDLLAESKSAASRLVNRGVHITRDSADGFVEQVTTRVVDESSEGDVALREVMRGVGGRAKPWARVLKAVLDGALPGGVRGDREGRITDLKVHHVTARHLLMGGPADGLPYAFQPGDLAGWDRLEITPSEVENHLNCTAQDVCWLVKRGLLEPVSSEDGPARYEKSQVEQLGRRLITTREVSARLGRKPTELWPELQSISLGGSLGQGFYERDVIEAWMVE
ncbi:MAG: hypothetical protein ACK4NU_00190 [Brevundimonas sp.]